VTGRLPPAPSFRLTVVADRTAHAAASGGFFNVRRLDLALQFPDGTTSAPFSYDVGAREALDAVVIFAHFSSRDGRRHVYLRSAMRPPCALRPLPPHHDGVLWELPAGLVEPGEDPADSAARELGEELGFEAPSSALRPLGHWTFPSPGIIGERHLFFEVEVDPSARRTPTEDGSALEHSAAILALPVTEALDHCRSGAIVDAKTELALRRWTSDR
jgi:ADP-ribose pyrophosphatase